MYFTIKSFDDFVILTDEVMEDISRIWSTLDDNVPTSVTISGYISQIFVYPASYQTYQFLVLSDVSGGAGLGSLAPVWIVECGKARSVETRRSQGVARSPPRPGASSNKSQSSSLNPELADAQERIIQVSTM